MDFRNMVGNLFFDRAKNVPKSKQLPEELVNGMYGTNFTVGGYRMVILCVANLADPDLREIEERMQRCGRWLAKRLAGECHDMLYHFDRLRIRLLLNYPPERDGHILFLLRSQVQAVPPVENGSYPVVACCSRLHSEIVEIGAMMEEASDIMWTRFASREPVLVHPFRTPPCPEGLGALFANTEQRLKAACAILDADAFRAELDAFFALPDEIVTRFETRRMIRSVEYAMFEENRDLISSFADVSRASREMVQLLRTATSLGTYKLRYRDHLLMLMRQIHEHSSAHLSLPIRKARRYIQDNHARPLRLEEVAAHVGLTPVYLCSRFREEVGMGFSDYCNHCRIEHAKTLLRDTGKPIVEIASLVGYSGPRYFSRVFRAQEGMNPSQYRNAAHGQTINPAHGDSLP